MERGRDGSRHAWNAVHATAEDARGKKSNIIARKHEAGSTGQLDSSGPCVRSSRICFETALLYWLPTRKQESAESSLDILIDPCHTSALALLEVAEAEKARANRRNAEDIAPAQIYAQVWWRLLRRGFQHICILEAETIGPVHKTASTV